MKDFLYEKTKAEHWKGRALIADARIEALEAALREIIVIMTERAGAHPDDVVENIAKAALAPEHDK